MSTRTCTLSGRSAPRDGAYVHGMYMEGARWDIQQGVILDSRLKELFPHMPVINIRVRFTTPEPITPISGVTKLCHYVKWMSLWRTTTGGVVAGGPEGDGWFPQLEGVQGASPVKP